MQPNTQAAVEGKPARAQTIDLSSATLECLVVAADEGRREMLTWAARDGGWETTACDNARSAIEYEQRRFLHLAIIDLVDVSPSGADEHLAMVERLSACGQLLLVKGIVESKDGVIHVIAGALYETMERRPASFGLSEL